MMEKFHVKSIQLPLIYVTNSIFMYVHVFSWCRLESH